ncbi:MAG: RsmE family RNA methyltransferase [Fibrobacterota bacterium]
MQTEHSLFFSRAIQDDYAILQADDAFHAHSVLRLGCGENIQFTDGEGTIFSGTIRSTNRDQVLVQIIQKQLQRSPSPPIELFVGIPEKNAFEQLIDLVVPLGVHSITPVVCTFCQKPWWKTRWEKIRERLEKKMIVGIKQSQSAFLPTLNEPKVFENALKSAPPAYKHVVATPSGRPFSELHLGAAAGIICWVGPPGGFSDTELSCLSGDLFQMVWLSPNRLRTELASAVVVATTIQCSRSPGAEK